MFNTVICWWALLGVGVVFVGATQADPPRETGPFATSTLCTLPRHQSALMPLPRTHFALRKIPTTPRKQLLPAFFNFSWRLHLNGADYKRRS